MEHTKVVVYLDLDVEVLPRWSLLLLHSHPSRHTDRQVVAVASEWAHLTACASSSASLLFSYPDHSSPVKAWPIHLPGPAACSLIRPLALLLDHDDSPSSLIHTTQPALIRQHFLMG